MARVGNLRRLVVLLLFLLTIVPAPPGRADNIGTPDSVSQSDLRANVQRYHRVWKVIKDHYYLPERLKDWSDWEHRFDPVLVDECITRKAIEEMLDSLGDDFCYLNEPAETYEANRKYRREVGCVSSMKLPENVGYIKIDSFKCGSVVKEVRRALTKLGGEESYVLDLRGNPGGYIKLTYGVFALFADSDRFITYASRDKDKPINSELLLTRRAEFLLRNGVCYKGARESDLVKHKPVVVLVDDQTRSAAEMLAGALREDGIATLVGVKTFGKGVLQNTWELDDGSSVKIVTGQYFLPQGECIHGIGIEPDLVVPAVPGSPEDVQLQAAVRTLMLHRQVTHAGQPTSHALL
jgi:C-terminal processing protease CtpA/Prc